MSSVAYNSTPRAILNGVVDDTPDVVEAVLQSLPTHLPHIFVWAYEGRTTPVGPISGSEREAEYGKPTFDLTSRFANHQTVLASKVNARGNAAIYHRLQAPDATPPATSRLYVDVLLTQVPEYERDESGKYILENGSPVPTGNTIPGAILKYVEGHANDEDSLFGQAVKSIGTMVDAESGDQSTLYPIFDNVVPSFGDHGNHKGYRLWAPTLSSGIPANEEVILDNNAYVFRYQQIKRLDDRSQPSVVTTARGSEYIDFTLKPDAIVTRTRQNLGAAKVLNASYQSKTTTPKRLGNFESVHLYQGYIDELLELLFTLEQPNQPEWPETAEEGKYLVNLFGGKSVNDVPYTAILLNGSSAGGTNLTQYTNHYCKGGSDGTMTEANFNAAVRQVMATYATDMTNQMMNMAKMPHSLFWDSGFEMETKYALMTPVGLRKDVGCIVATQDVSAPQNTSESEASTLMALKSYSRNFIESELHGTGCCRIAVVGHSGWLADDTWEGILPLTIDLVDKVANSMGASSGVWSSDGRFDEAPGNVVTMFRDVNLTFKTEDAATFDWTNGLIGVQSYDIGEALFYPAYQTVYDDKTSPLNSLFNMFLFIELEKVCHRNWRRMSGGHSRLTPGEFIDKSNADILADIDDGKRFDDRYIIEVVTKFTDIDVQLGYSYSVDIIVYTNDNRYLGSYTIYARDRAQLAAAA
jgi:hypothetical protein